MSETITAAAIARHRGDPTALMEAAVSDAAAIAARIGGATLAIWREQHTAILAAMHRADPLAAAPADRHGSRPAEKVACHALAELAGEVVGWSDGTAPEPWQARLAARAAAKRAAVEAARAADEAAEPARLLARIRAEGSAGGERCRRHHRAPLRPGAPPSRCAAPAQSRNRQAAAG